MKSSIWHEYYKLISSGVSLSQEQRNTMFLDIGDRSPRGLAYDLGDDIAKVLVDWFDRELYARTDEAMRRVHS